MLYMYLLVFFVVVVVDLVQIFGTWKSVLSKCFTIITYIQEDLTSGSKGGALP